MIGISINIFLTYLSLRIRICVQYPPAQVAAASIYLASRFILSKVPEEDEAWKRVFNTTIAEAESKSFF